MSTLIEVGRCYTATSMPTTELELSIMAASPDGVRPLLDQFEAEQGIHVRLRLALVRFLSEARTQIAYGQVVGLLPTRLDALTGAPLAGDAWWQLAIHGLKTGRSFPVTRSWGLMEDRLTRALKALWDEVLADPNLELEAAIARHLVPLAMRLDLVLGH